MIRQGRARELSETILQLQSTQYRKERTKQQLRQLSRQIASQTALLDSLQLVKNQTASHQARHVLVAAALELDITALRDQYQALIRSFYRQQRLRDAAPPLGRLRWRAQQQLIYQKHIHQHRHQQLHTIQNLQQDLMAYARNLASAYDKQDTLLKTLSYNQETLSRDQQQQNRQMKVLRQRERQLRQTLSKQKKAKKLLSKKIEQAILKQIAEAKAKARQYQAQQKKNANTKIPL